MKIIAMAAGRERELSVEPLEEEGRWRVVIDGAERIVDARRVGPGSWSLLLGDEAIIADVDPGKNGDLLVEVRGVTVAVKPLDPRAKLLERAGVQRVSGAAGPTPVAAPMPGKVVKVLVKEGDEVTAGQGIVIVEAMKMENELRAPRAGKILAVRAREGQPVEAQETLVTIE